MHTYVRTYTCTYGHYVHMDKSFLFPNLKIITILPFFHAVCIRLSYKHLVYSLASVIEIIYSPAFNVSMVIWSLPVAVAFFISRSFINTFIVLYSASIRHAGISTLEK